MVATTPEDALFLVNRDGTNYHGKGLDLNDRMVAGDIVLVERDNERFKATYAGGSTWPTIQDDDLVLAWDDEKSRSVSGANFKALFETACPDIAGLVVMVPSPVQYAVKFDVMFLDMPAGAEYLDFYKTCYTATIIEQTPMSNFITPIYEENKLRIFYNKAKAPNNTPITIDVKFTNNADPQDVTTIRSNIFLLTANP